MVSYIVADLGGVLAGSPMQDPFAHVLRFGRQSRFRHVGVLETIGFKHGRWLDSVLMQRVLGPGTATLPGELGSKKNQPSASCLEKEYYTYIAP